MMINNCSHENRISINEWECWTMHFSYPILFLLSVCVTRRGLCSKFTTSRQWLLQAGPPICGQPFWHLPFTFTFTSAFILKQRRRVKTFSLFSKLNTFVSKVVLLLVSASEAPLIHVVSNRLWVTAANPTA
jgi:hypothetical protein